ILLAFVPKDDDIRRGCDVALFSEKETISLIHIQKGLDKAIKCRPDTTYAILSESPAQGGHLMQISKRDFCYVEYKGNNALRPFIQNDLTLRRHMDLDILTRQIHKHVFVNNVRHVVVLDGTFAIYFKFTSTKGQN